MKKYSLTTLLLLMALTSTAHIRNGRIVDRKEFDLPYKHDLNISWGMEPTAETVGNYTFSWSQYQGGLDDIYGNYMGKGLTSGVISVDYSYKINKLVALGAQLNGSVTRHTEMSAITGEAAHQFRNYALAGLATAKFTYIRRQYFRMYTTIGLGIRYQGGGPQNEIHNYLDTGPGVAAFWIPYGFSFGKKVYASAEMIAGTECMGIRFGIGYRF